MAKRFNSELKQRRQPEVVFFSFLDGGLAQMFGQIVSLVVKTLRNTNLVASRCFKMKKTSLPVDVRRSKTPLLLGGGMDIFWNYTLQLPILDHRGKK